MSALGAARLTNDVPENPQGQLKTVLEFCLDPESAVPRQNRIDCLQACASWSHASRVATWEAIKTNWTYLSGIVNRASSLTKLFMVRLIQ